MRTAWSALRDKAEGFYPHLAHRTLIFCLPAFVAGLLAAENPVFILFAAPSLLFARTWVAAALLALGLSRALFATPAPEPLLPGEYKVTGLVQGTPVIGKGWQRFVLDAGDRRLLVTASSHQMILAGDAIRVEGLVKRIVVYSDSPAQGQQRYWERRGITQQMNVVWDGSMEVVSAGHSLRTLGSAWRTGTWQRLRRHIPERHASMAMGILAGQQALVGQDVMENMQRAGTLHLLATSGFNILILTGALMLILSHLPIPRHVQIGIVILLLIVYAGAVGGRPPVVRATLMASLYLSTFLFKRSGDGLSALGAAALLYLLFEPAAIHDAGTQLSFMAALGMLLYLPAGFDAMRSRLSGMRSGALRLSLTAVGSVMLTTVIAQVSSAGLIAGHFGIFSIIAPITNVVTASAVPLIYLGSFCSEVASWFYEPASRGFDIILTGTFSAWVDVSNSYLGNLRWSALSFEPVSGWLVASYCMGLVLLSRPRRRTFPDE